MKKTLLIAVAAASALFVWAGPAAADPPRPVAFNVSSFSESGAYATAADDFDISGTSDLVTTDPNLHKITVRRTNYDGSTMTTDSYPLPGGVDRPLTVRAGDVNGDGLPDIVATVDNTNKFAVWLNSWSHLGTFDPAVVQTLPSFGTANCTTPTELAIGDLNDDGTQDLAFACYGSDYVLALYNSGNGLTYAGFWIWFEADGPISLGIGDMNNDAHNDLVIADWFSKQVAVMLNNKHGVFPTVVDYSVPNAPNEIALGDYNEDGKLDVATSNTLNGLSTLKGNGDGTLQAPVNILTGHTTYWALTGDMNGDGHLDLVSPDNNAGNLDVFLGQGDGTFPSKQSFATGPGPIGESIGDFDWDGRPDVAVVNGNSTVSMLLNITHGGEWTSTGPILNATVGKIISVGTWPTQINFPVLYPGESSAGFDFTSTYVKTNDNAGYQLSLHRTPFSAGDIPLAIRDDQCFHTAPTDLNAGWNSIPTAGEINASHRGGGVFPYADYTCYYLKLGPVPFVNAGTHRASLVWTAVGF